MFSKALQIWRGFRSRLAGSVRASLPWYRWKPGAISGAAFRQKVRVEF
jgi:hypothetical protein